MKKVSLVQRAREAKQKRIESQLLQDAQQQSAEARASSLEQLEAEHAVLQDKLSEVTKQLHEATHSQDTEKARIQKTLADAKVEAQQKDATISALLTENAMLKESHKGQTNTENDLMATHVESAKTIETLQERLRQSLQYSRELLVLNKALEDTIADQQVTKAEGVCSTAVSSVTPSASLSIAPVTQAEQAHRQSVRNNAATTLTAHARGLYVRHMVKPKRLQEVAREKAAQTAKKTQPSRAIARQNARFGRV